jgi:hypothetical protein
MPFGYQEKPDPCQANPSQVGLLNFEFYTAIKNQEKITRKEYEIAGERVWILPHKFMEPYPYPLALRRAGSQTLSRGNASRENG